MPRKRTNIATAGMTFGKLKVLFEFDAGGGNWKAKCLCECGSVTVVAVRNLCHDHTRSCGCMPNTGNRVHGLAWAKDGKMNKLYGVWLAIKRRCKNPNDASFPRYGGRGISVCEKWSKSYLEFHKWAMSSGYTVGLTIERIDNNGNYEPRNCAWASRTEQANNRRTNHVIRFNGRSITLAQASGLYGLKQHTILCRLKRGWTIEDALSKPLDNRGSRHASV